MTTILSATLGAVGGWGILIALTSLWNRRRLSLADRVAPHVAAASQSAFHAAFKRREVSGLSSVVRRQLHRIRDRSALLANASGLIAQIMARSESEITVSALVLRIAGMGSIGLTVGLVFGFLGVIAGGPITLIPLGLIAGAAMATAFPLAIMRHRDKTVRARVVQELPIVLSFVTTSLRAGESLPRALARVAHNSRGRLGREFGRAVESMGLGLRLDEALLEIARRWEVAEVSQAIDTIVLAMESGAPVAEVLSVRVEELATRQGQRQIEKASRQEVGLLVPLVFLILPVTVVFAVLPGLLALNSGLW